MDFPDTMIGWKIYNRNAEVVGHVPIVKAAQQPTHHIANSYFTY